MSESGTAGGAPKVFNGKRFWISLKVPSRTHYSALVKDNGGEVVNYERSGADYYIADDLKDKKLVGDYTSYKFIEKCIRERRIVDTEPFRVGKLPDEKQPGNDSTVGETSTSQAADKKKTGRAVRSRVPFSKSDDLFLLNSLANNGSSANTAGNALYKEMARQEPHHTMHSWRSRWYEHLKNIVPEEDLWGPNPCYGDNAKRKPGPLTVTRMRVADPGTDSDDEANTSRASKRRASQGRRQSGKVEDPLQKARQRVRQQQNDDFEREALQQEEEEERAAQAKKLSKGKFTLAEDNQLLMVHGVIPTLSKEKREGVFKRLAKKFPQHTAEEWEKRYNTHIVPEATKALLDFGDEEGEGNGTDREDGEQPELQDQIAPQAPATAREPSPELGERPQDSTVEDIDSVARVFGARRKTKGKGIAKPAAPRVIDVTHTPEKQIRHEVTKPPVSPSGHGLKELEDEEPQKLTTPQQPFSPSSNRKALEKLRSSPNNSPSLQRRRRQSTPQAQISSAQRKAPRSPKGHPVTSPPAPEPEQQITLTTTATSSKASSVQQWLGDVPDTEPTDTSATTKKAVPAALLKYHKLSKSKKRARAAEEAVETADQKRIKKDAAGTKAPVRSTTPEAPPPQPVAAAPARNRTPDPVAPIAPMVAPAPDPAPAPAPTPAPTRRSGRSAAKQKEPTPPPAPQDQDEIMTDSWVQVSHDEVAPPPKRGRGRPPKVKKEAKKVPARRDVKEMSTQDLYALGDPMDQSGEMIPIEQSTEKGNDTTMDFTKIDKDDVMITQELEEVGEEDEDEQALDDYIKTVAGWKEKYGLQEKEVLDVIMMCSKVEDLIVKVLDSLSKGKGIPQIAGVWSKEDDKELQSGSPQAIEKMAKKHGQENIDIRYEYLNSINTYNSENSGKRK